MKQLHIFILTLTVLVTVQLRAQVIPVSQKTTKFSAKQLFSAEEPMELTLLSDFKKIRSQKRKGEFQDAIATLHLSAIDSVTDAASICARGEFRRELCQMPSLTVNFKTEHATSLKGLKKLKLVCGCSSSDANERLVLMEYLTYRIYNLLTEKSFKARLVKVNYKDVNNKVKAYTQYAFFIEDVDDMASRNGCKEFENKLASSQMSNREQMTLLNLFQYMIGNTDWSVPNYHNIKLMTSKIDSTSAPYAVPYDFDFAGIVNAPYAFPNEMFNIQKVTDRLYRGYPRTEGEIEAALQIFRNVKEKITSLIMNFELLKLSDRESMLKYVDGFYATINKKSVKNEFINGAQQ